MGIKEKLEQARKEEWITKDKTESELKNISDLALISAAIEMKRVDMNMTQKEFAEYLGISQAMVSKLESREYNFTIRMLNDIFARLELSLEFKIGDKFKEQVYEEIPMRESAYSRKVVEFFNKVEKEDLLKRGIA